MEKHNKMAEKFKNLKNKLPKSFKKQGFFLAIFVLLCGATIVGTVALKKANLAEKTKEKAKEQLTLNVDENKEEKPKDTMDNSERVKKDEAAKTKQDASKNNSKQTKAVSAQTKNDFIAPVSGKIIRDYKKPLKDGAGQRILPGITISCKEGSDIKAAEAGVVEESKDEAFYGTTVTIKHTNGIKTVYSNLDKKIAVKKGDKVTKGQVIGKVGKSAQGLQLLLEENKIKESFCNIEMSETKDKKEKDIDPTKYLEIK